MKNRSEWNLGVPELVVGESRVVHAQNRVIACEACSQSVSRRFGSLLAKAGTEPAAPDYAPTILAVCPGCGSRIGEDTLVRVHDDWEIGTADVPTGPIAANWQDSADDGSEAILLFRDQVRQAQTFISGCIRCVPRADLPFIYILDELTESDPATTRYVLSHPARCPTCDNPVSEKTLVVGCGPLEDRSARPDQTA